jgi:DNA-binding transcriptional LysR family regulator
MHHDDLIDLNDLRVFAYVASLGSFSLAAHALRLHKSSVSRSITRLEEALAMPLIERTTRQVRLTTRGVALQQDCVEMLSRVKQAVGRHAAVRIAPAGLVVRSGPGGLRPWRPLSAGRCAEPAASCSAAPGTSS